VHAVIKSLFAIAAIRKRLERVQIIEIQGFRIWGNEIWDCAFIWTELWVTVLSYWCIGGLL
jgi:hypothetical protein